MRGRHPSTMSSADEELAARYFRATAALERGETETARREFEVLLLDVPRFAAAWDGLGGCFDREGDLRRAGECYRKAMRLDRRGWRSRYNWGAVLHRAGNLAEARRWLQEALRLAPTERRIHQRLGQCHFDAGKFDRALACFQRALEQPENDIRDAELWVSIGSAHLEAGDLSEAEDAYSRACLLSPDDPDVLFNWALVAARQGDEPAAERLALRARGLERNSHRATVFLVELALDAGRWDAAEGRLRELEQSPGAQRLARALRAERALRIGDHQAARELALQTLQLDGSPADQAVDRALATLRTLSGRRKAVRGYRLLVEALHGECSYFRPYVVLAEDPLEARDYVAALQNALDPSPWSVVEEERFVHDGEAVSGVYHLLLTRVLFPREREPVTRL